MEPDFFLGIVILKSNDKYDFKIFKIDLTYTYGHAVIISCYAF